tara:strand:- start:236 stop:1144 length:909 start_codon:yes stop_codon:yes gene_type:complete
MTAIICGSFAYDHILEYKGKFNEHLIESDLNSLSVSFLCEDMRQEFGGCAGNIIYNLNGINADAFAMGMLGKDSSRYVNWLESKNISTKFIGIRDDSFTAQAYITTDNDNNQITTFHPGAMKYSGDLLIPSDGSISLGMISPDGRDGMLSHTNQFIELGIPYVFDPGQGLPMFNKDELIFFTKHADWIIMNNYEYKMFYEKTKKPISEIVKEGKVFIVTNGSEGSEIYINGNSLKINTRKQDKVLDPTGCGDAYRAGLIYGIMNNMPWEKTGELSSDLGSNKVSFYGTQNHSFPKYIKDNLI